MKKICLIFLLFIFLFLVSPTLALAENKAGINIAANHQDFEKAAEIVGPGGWIVMMACPGDADKIAEYINSPRGRDINLIIRGHYAGTNPDAKLAKAWAATLGSLPTPNKIYFMPWNEPNQEDLKNGNWVPSNDYGTPEQVDQYIKDLVRELGSLKGSKVVLLSPMINQSHPNFSSYVQKLKSINPNFFNQFDGISMNLYDNCESVLNCPSKYLNPKYSNDILAELGVNKPVYGVEAGTAGVNFYWKEKPTSSSPLYKFVEQFKGQTTARMFAIPSYDLAGEVGHTWSLFDPPAVTDLLKSMPKGGTSRIGNIIVQNSMNLCPDKKYTFYQNDITECTECGGGGFSLLACKPIDANKFGDEYSRETLMLKENIRYSGSDPDCIEKYFSGKATIKNVEIPLANELNQYFLGPLVDKPQLKIQQEASGNMMNVGAFEKLAPPDLKDRLKLGFLNEIKTRGAQSKYKNFKIGGRGPEEIANKFREIKDKQNNNKDLTAEEKQFLKIVWPQIPMFANEESEGEIVFEGNGFNATVKTSVPEVYRLNYVTTVMAKMVGIYRSVEGDKQKSVAVPATCSVPEIPVVKNAKEGMTGTGEAVCTKEEIQPEQLKTENIFGYQKFSKEAVPGGGICPSVGESCEEFYAEACTTDDGLSGRKVCHKLGSCTCEGGGTCCSWGADSSCGECTTGEIEVPGNSVRPGFATKTVETEISVKNRVPFLKQIVENTVGPGGVLRILVPMKDQTPAQQEVIEHEFREVAGESTINKEDFDLRLTTNSPNISFEVEKPSQLTLLFQKLGTIVNVKNFVSSKLFSPYKVSSAFTKGPSTPPTSDNLCSFSAKNSGQTISADTRAAVIAQVKSSWPDSKIDQEVTPGKIGFDYVAEQARSRGWNPAVVLSLWIEESGASGVLAKADMGCLDGKANTLDNQLNCVLSINYADNSCQDFLCMYSEGKGSPCTFDLNPNFPGNYMYWYERLTQ